MNVTRIAPALVATAAFAVHARAVAPLPWLLDSAEMASASFGLGIAHPPGEPVALLVGKLAAWLPFGGVALRVGLGQAGASALAAAIVTWLGVVLVGRVLGKDRDLVAALLGAAAGLVFATAPGVRDAAERPEVYALSSALALGAVACAVHSASRWDVRPALLAAVLLGLGLGTHPLVVGLTGLGAIAAAGALLGGRGRPAAAPRGRLVVGAVVGLVAGAVVLVYVPVRAAALAFASDQIAWGDARTARGLWWVLSAQTFAGKASVVHGSADPSALPFVLIDELGVPVLVFALLGGYAGVRSRDTRHVVASLLVGIVGAIAAALVAGFDPSNPDIRGYLGPALGLLAVLAAVGAGFAVRAVAHAHGGLGLAGVLALAALVLALPRAAAVGLRQARAADAVAGALLAELPPSAVLLTGHFETAFLVSYARLVEGRRPDVAWAHLGFGRSPGYAERLGARDPDLATLLASHARGPLDEQAALAVAARRTVAIEPIGDLSPNLVRVLVPGELVWSVPAPRAEVSATTRSARSYVEALATDEASRSRAFAGFREWRALVDAQRACEAGLPVARAKVAALVGRRPQDSLVRALADRCR